MIVDTSSGHNIFGKTENVGKSSSSMAMALEIGAVLSHLARSGN
jgi:hypothetical protein